MVCAALGLALSGCSVATSTTFGGVSDAAAVKLGELAAGATSSGASTASPSDGTSGWSSTIGCPDTFRQGLLSSTPAGTTLTRLDVSTTTGVISDPSLFAGDIPNCAYEINESGHLVDAVVFVGMPASYQNAIVATLAADGFTAGATSPDGNGTLQLFSNSSARIAIERLTEGNVSFFGITG